MTGEMVNSAESVSYLDSIELMELGSNATIWHIGLFGMIQLCLLRVMSQCSQSRPIYAFALLFVLNPASPCECI